MANRSIPELSALRDKVPAKYYEILLQFFNCYKEAVPSFEETLPTLRLFLELLQEQFRSPYVFEPYHRKIRSPIDYYRFGLDFIRPLVDLPHSKIFGRDQLETIAAQLKRGENVILFANHQTETDPQAIAILLEKNYPEIAESIIYVAGERVTTDPLAIPFSMGCDLLCIYSKRYVNEPPELKEEKKLHNKKTMVLMSRLLQEGSKIIYVAPSGGRDRRNAQGVVEIAPFDAGSIEMFYLMAKRAKRITHFYPLALATYDLLPPPETIQKELGEVRMAKRTPIHLFFCEEFDMKKYAEVSDKVKKRERRAQAIWSEVNSHYRQCNL